ncbi:GIY-YIG nuclease family protein [uncultured Nostoc sp.]|uniref:GIY-YIG nuclease family protein n=1 Tax=uncultured Nostoc sp. TaxID=340711 RepID=UPI0035CBB97C
MISPESIDLLALPSVQLSDKRSLPHCPAIYFVLDSEEIVYIGQTNSLLLRWQAHHKLKECKALENPRIAWIEISDTTLVLDIEAALIEWFKPSLNKHGWRETKLSLNKHGWRETKKRYQIMLTKTASVELDKVSEELETSRSELIEKAIRQGLFRQVKLEPSEMTDD